MTWYPCDVCGAEHDVPRCPFPVAMESAKPADAVVTPEGTSDARPRALPSSDLSVLAPPRAGGNEPARLAYIDAVTSATGLVASERNRWEGHDVKTFEHWEQVLATLNALILTLGLNRSEQRRAIEPPRAGGDVILAELDRWLKLCAEDGELTHRFIRVPLVRDLTSVLTRLTEERDTWRQWIQSVWLGGGQIVDDDETLKFRACAEHDRELREATAQAEAERDRFVQHLQDASDARGVLEQRLQEAEAQLNEADAAINRLNTRMWEAEARAARLADEITDLGLVKDAALVRAARAEQERDEEALTDADSLIGQLRTRLIDPAGCLQQQHEQGGDCASFWPERLQYWCRSCLISAVANTLAEAARVKDAIVGCHSWGTLADLFDAVLSAKHNADEEIATLRSALRQKEEELKELQARMDSRT